MGQVRDGFPRITLSLPGKADPIRVEFVFDTGFDGELAVPMSVLHRLDATLVSNRAVQLAGQRLSRKRDSLSLVRYSAPEH